MAVCNKWVRKRKIKSVGWQKYITSSFVTDLSSYVGKQVDSVTNVQFSTQSSEITPEFFCNLDDVLKIMWT